MFFSLHRHSYKKQSSLATVTHNRLLLANSGSEGFWLREPYEKEKGTKMNVAFLHFCSRLVEPPESLRYQREE